MMNTISAKVVNALSVIAAVVAMNTGSIATTAGINLFKVFHHNLSKKNMNTQQFLTYFINTFVLSSTIFFLLDFCLYLVNSWQQLSPSGQPSFYCQVKDLLWDNDNQLKLQT